MWQIIRGNTTVRDIPVYDKNGALVQNLDDAEEIYLHVLKERNRECNAIIQKNKSNGIEINVPEIGYLRITLLPSETRIPARKYFVVDF